jgi:predicted Rossmann fold nucleotide-binding protein DprA/Smf involved in DNA uptake
VCLAPAGLRHVPPGAALDISLSPPEEPFTVGAAMERNPLIFAAAEATVVVHARLRAGGGWQGATEALRRRLGPVLVREDTESAAHRALIALGAWPLREPGDLAAVLRRASIGSAQAGLFTAG